MSANVSNKSANESATPAPAVPKRITNAQTVCNEKNEKGKLCNGHLKQLRTAGEAAKVHLRGDDVLSKCQTCGTFYMGPPLGHVRDPQKQTRFVEAELTALLQAAGGTLPVIKKNDQGMFVIVEPEGQQAAAKPAVSATPAAPGTAGVPPASGTPPVAAKVQTPAAAPKHKVGADPNRQLFRRSTYAGVADTGPVAGETFAQKVERLRKVSAGAKQRTEEGGGPAPKAEAASAEAAAAPAIEAAAKVVTAAPVSETPVSAAPATEAAHKPTGKADRGLMKRSTYCGVADTGPVAGESFADKVARLAKVSAAVKQRADEGGN